MAVYENYSMATNIRKIPYETLNYLFDNTSNMWKVLKYGNSHSPLREKEVTNKEKENMIAKTSLERDAKNIVMQRFTSQALTEGISQLRIEIMNTRPVRGNKQMLCTLLFQIIIPNENQIIATDLTPYDRRDLVILQDIIKALNGVHIDGVGEYFLNSEIDVSTGANAVSFSDEHSGYQFAINVLLMDG